MGVILDYNEFWNITMIDDRILPETNMFTSAIARVRAKEVSLLSKQDLENLMQCETADDCITALIEKGWGPTPHNTPEEFFVAERDKCWEFIKSIVSAEDLYLFESFRLKNDYHNLKVAIKEAYSQKSGADAYLPEGLLSIDKIKKCVEDSNFECMSYIMRKAAKEAKDLLFRTGDSQLCDVIIDRASLREVYKAGYDLKRKDPRNKLLFEYADLRCSAADINISIRASKAKKDTEFLRRAFAETASISVDRLVTATRNGDKSIYEYLEETPFRDAIEPLRKGYAAFDKWCDDRLMNLIQPEKYSSFGISPIVAYMLAKELEIKSVRIILSGKINGLDEEMVRERIRESYV